MIIKNGKTYYKNNNTYNIKNIDNLKIIEIFENTSNKELIRSIYSEIGIFSKQKNIWNNKSSNKNYDFKKIIPEKTLINILIKKTKENKSCFYVIHDDCFYYIIHLDKIFYLDL